jgi:hypothetical protein
VKTIVLIDGREAVPVRALPFVTGWSLSPDMLAMDMAKRSKAFLNRKTNLRAYQYDADGTCAPINPSEWEQIIIELEALALRVRRATGERDAGTYATWREESPSCLPKACFVWRNEFESVFNQGLTSAGSPDEDSDALMLNFSPLVPSGLQAMVMEGFQVSSTAEKMRGNDRRWPWGNYETELLKHLAAAADRFWVRYDPEDPPRANVT